MTNFIKQTEIPQGIDSRSAKEVPHKTTERVQSQGKLSQAAESNSVESVFNEMLYEANRESTVKPDVKLEDIIEQLSLESAENLVAKQPSAMVIGLTTIVRTDTN